MADENKKQRFINWNAATERQIDAIGNYMQSIAERLKDDVYPIADLRWKGGWRTSIIVETAIEKVGRDLPRIKPEMWQAFAQEYFNNREMNERKLTITTQSDAALDTIAKHLDKSGFERIREGRGINKKLVISMCLSYVEQKIRQE